jgi:hypothetical protein
LHHKIRFCANFAVKLRQRGVLLVASIMNSDPDTSFFAEAKKVATAGTGRNGNDTPANGVIYE